MKVKVNMPNGFKVGQSVYYAKYNSNSHKRFTPDISKVYKIVITQEPSNDSAFYLQYILEANKAEKVEGDYVCKTERECRKICRILNRF